MNQILSTQPKVALVTGSSIRIGASIAEFLHEKGYNIALHYHTTRADAENLAACLNAIRKNSVFVFQQDLRVSHCGQDLINAVVENLGWLDVLVNNASVFIKDRDNFHSGDWEHSFNVNVRAPYALSLAAFPHLAKRQGNIINITDIHAMRPLSGYTLYCQTKAALTMQTKALAKQFAPSIRVNAVAPGAITWPENDNAVDESIKSHIIEKTPLKCHGNPHYIASAVFSLLNNEFITGHILCVDGGRSLM